MLQFNVIPESNKVLVQYPKPAKRPSKVIQNSSVVSLDKKWEIETRAYIYTTLRRWVLQRNAAYKSKRELNGKRAADVDKLLIMLIQVQFSTLHTMCRKVVDNYEIFISLFPTQYSKNIDYTRQVIAPILLWCKEYRDQIDLKK